MGMSDSFPNGKKGSNPKMRNNRPNNGPKRGPNLKVPKVGPGPLPVNDDMTVLGADIFSRMMQYPMGYQLLSRANNRNLISNEVNLASVISFEAEIALWGIHFSVQFLTGPGVNPNDPDTWILTIKSTLGTRIVNEVFPIVREILKTGVGQRTNVSNAALAWYFSRVEECMQPILHVLAYRRLYYNADWTKIDPGTSDIPYSLTQQMGFIKGFDADFEALWMVMIRLLSNKVFPPELKALMVNFHTPFIDSADPSCFRLFTPYAPGVDYATLASVFYGSYQYISLYGADVEATLASFVPWKVGAIDLGEVKHSPMKTALWYDGGNAGRVAGITTSIPSIATYEGAYANILFTPDPAYYGESLEYNFLSNDNMAGGLQALLSGALKITGTAGAYYLQAIGIAAYTAIWIWYDDGATIAKRIRAGDVLVHSDNRIAFNQVRNRWMAYVINNSMAWTIKGVVDQSLDPTIVSENQIFEVNGYTVQLLLGADKLRDISTAVGGSANREARAYISNLFGVNT